MIGVRLSTCVGRFFRRKWDVVIRHILATVLGLIVFLQSGSAQKLPPLDQFRFGIAYGHGPDNHDPEVARRCAEIGIDLARGHIGWGRTQPKQDVWNWEESDAVVAAHAAAGTEVQILLSGAPQWAWKKGYKVSEHVRPHTIPPRTDAWRNWCREVAKRYRGKVRMYEIWNEPDIGFWAGTQDEYLELFKVASEEIRAVDPQAVILTGGFASMSHKETKPGMIRRVLAEEKDSFDRIAYHRHGFFDEFAREVDGYLIPLREATGNADKPLHFTETAMDTRKGERHQAETLVKKITFAKARGAAAHTWFNFHDFNRGGAPADQPGTTYGLFTIKGKPKLSATAYKVLIAKLRDTVPVKQIDAGEGHWVFLFKRGSGAHVVVAWTEMKSGPLLAFRTDSAEVSLTGLLGETRSLPVRENILACGLTPDPVYYDFPAAGAAPELEVIAAELTSHPSSGEGAQELVAVFRNPFSTPQKVGLEWEIPKGFATGEPPPEEIGIMPKERVEVRVTMRAETGKPFHYPARKSAGLNYDWKGLKAGGELRAEVKANVVPLTSGDFPKGFGEQDLLLGESWQVERLAEHDPNSMQLIWTGWNDLHSKIWFRRKGDATNIRVLRRDAESGAGDGTEIIFLMPDGKETVLKIPGDGSPPEASLVTDGVEVAVPLTYEESAPPIRVLRLRLDDSVSGFSTEMLKEGVPFHVISSDDDGSGVETRIYPEGPGIQRSRWPVLKLD